MSSHTAFDAIEGHLRSEFTGAPLVFENEPWPQQETPSTFVLVEVFGDFYVQESIGAPGQNLWRETGQILMHVLVPNDTGSREARMVARELVGLFREVSVDGVHFGEMSIGAGEPGEEKSQYYRITASVDFWRDEY